MKKISLIPLFFTLILTLTITQSVKAQSTNSEIKSLQQRLDRLELATSRIDTSNKAALNGYFNFDYVDSDAKGDHSRFRSHHFVLFVSKQVGKFNFFSETEFEYAPKFEGKGGDVKGQGEILLERSWIEYIQSDLLAVRAGLILTPTYWRLNHYPSLVPSVTRPLIDKKVFPPDLVGLMAYGTKFLGDGGISYNIYTGNGDSPNPGKTDINKNKALGGKITLHAPVTNMLDYLDIAVHIYSDKLRTGERAVVGGLELILERYPFILLSEYASKETGDVKETSGLYIQPSLNIIPQVTVFYRFEDFKDKTATSMLKKNKHTIGAVYKPIPDISIKFNYAREEFDDESIENINILESAFVFFF